jgi:hypothetical protein
MIRVSAWTLALITAAVAAAVAAAASPPDSTVVPIRLSGSFALVEVRIGGRDVSLLFDTGDSRGILLAQPVIDRIKAKPVGQSSKVIDVKGNIVESPHFEIPRLQIGSIEFANVIADLDVHDPSYQPDQHGQQGFLGTALLKPYQVVIDYSRLTLTLIAPGSSRARAGDCRGVAVPFVEQWRGEPVTEAETEFGRVVLWWDTGTPLSILTARFAQQARPRIAEGSMISERLGLGGSEFGPWPFEVVDFALPPGFEGFIGYDFFAQHVVCMDFPGRRALVRRN